MSSVKPTRGEPPVEPPEVQLDQLEDRVERLRALYDQYFMGIERLEPLIPRKEIERRIFQLRREQIRNTALRFRVQTVIQRYNTYEQYWQRICREIESGTYHRDLSRAAARFGDAALTAMGRRRQQMFQKGAAKQAEREAERAASNAPPASGQVSEAERSSAEAPPNGGLGSSALELDASDVLFELEEIPDSSTDAGSPSEAAAVAGSDVATEAGASPWVAPRSEPDGSVRGPARPRTASARPPRRRTDPPAPEVVPLSRLRAIYGEYVQARRTCHESTAALTFDGLSATLREKARLLQSRHPGHKVDFRVSVEHGGAVLTPVLKGEPKG